MGDDDGATAELISRTMTRPSTPVRTPTVVRPDHPTPTLLTAVRRFAWLMLGAAIGLASALVGYSILGIANVERVWLAIPIVFIAGICLGLVPGARELEVTAAKTMLTSTAELVTPDKPLLAHRLQTMIWVTFHLVAGLAVAAALIAGVPYAVMTIVDNVAGRATDLMVPVAETVGGRAAVIGLCAVGAAVCLAVFWPIGRLAQALAGRLLGPTAQDRLMVALDRASREAEHTRLARELHDGIGHALTVVKVQAAAGKRIGERDPDAAAEAFAAIEEVTAAALADLDHMLGILRQDHDRSEVAVDLDQIVQTHRRAGLIIKDEIDLPEGLPPLLRRNVHRIVSEALTNAHRHGRAGPVTLRVAVDDQISIIVSNPRGRSRTRAGGGRGLAGIGERVALFGGTVDAGPVDDQWQLSVMLPWTKEDGNG